MYKSRLVHEPTSHSFGHRLNAEETRAHAQFLGRMVRSDAVSNPMIALGRWEDMWAELAKAEGLHEESRFFFAGVIGQRIAELEALGK